MADDFFCLLHTHVTFRLWQVMPGDDTYSHCQRLTRILVSVGAAPVRNDHNYVVQKHLY